MKITSITVCFEDGSVVTTNGEFVPVTPPTPEQVEAIAEVAAEITAETAAE